MKRAIRLSGDVYSIASFSKEFGYPYTKVLSLYDQGYRDQELVDKLKSEQLVIAANTFKSLLQASQYYGIPPTTFYRYAKKGKLKKLIKRKKLLDKYDLN